MIEAGGKEVMEFKREGSFLWKRGGCRGGSQTDSETLKDECMLIKE